MAATTAVLTGHTTFALSSLSQQQIQVKSPSSVVGESRQYIFSRRRVCSAWQSSSNSQCVVLYSRHLGDCTATLAPCIPRRDSLGFEATFPCSNHFSVRSKCNGVGKTRQAGCLNSRKQRKNLVQAAAGAGAAPATGTDETPPLPEQIARFQQAFWKFTRPHTIRGTIMGSFMVVARTLLENSHAIDWGLTPRALRGVLGLLCGNAYIVGINQVFDVDIDKVNKPFLPIAAGELSVPTAVGLCILLAAAGVTIVATNFGPVITALYSFGLFLGTVYSVPPLQLKRFPIPAFLIIATVRGFLLNFGVHSATRAALGLPFIWSPSIVFITTFVTVFSTVIALTKDLPDVEGDRKYNITTFATSLGVRNVAFLAVALLLANYAGAIVCAVRMPQAFKPTTMIGGHVFLALYLGYQTWLLEKRAHTKEAIAAFYRGIWNLFYSEYLLLPFI